MGIGVQEVPKFIVTSAEAGCRAHGTEATHWTISALDPSMILLKSVVIRHNSRDATSKLVKSWAAGCILGRPGQGRREHVRWAGRGI